MEAEHQISQSLPEHAEYYRELTTRNKHFISPGTQLGLKKLKVLIAGCGSTGGACIESLARAGVENFALADNGAYELNNLNRQHATRRNLGQNKAEFHAEQLRGINPFVQLIVHPEGISFENVDGLVGWADLIMDAVDVTTESGIRMKLALHERAKKAGKPVFTALDIGFSQWGYSYDYRNPELAVLGGLYQEARAVKHPLKALFTFVPLSAVPPHALQLVEDLLIHNDVSASQLGCTSDLLASIIVPAAIRFVETGALVSGWEINLEYLALSPKKRFQLWMGAPAQRRRVRKLLAKLP